ncbi:MAG TPA: carboxypeptidase-like regulatory domain-containing protein [Bryobacteraceae bacterium]|nr:carboxypeptidase-like regulatory domain-containing protein [Bryobacteraceae bacterium]
MFSKSMSISTLLLLALLWSGVAALGQSTGIISGTVTDQSGAIISGATVTITNKATSAARNLASNAEGLFNAPSLEAGQYEVRVEAPGFRTLVRSTEVFAGTDTTVNASMTLGESQQVINVEAAAAQINYENNTIAGVVERQSIQAIPLNGRSFFQLGSLEPGVSVQTSALGARNGPVKITVMGGSGGTGGAGGGNLGTGGGTTYLSLDGLSIMDALELDPAMTFSQEMVGEFQISTINYQVGPSVTSVGAVNVVSRSGSNDLHGSGFFFYRDHNMAAYPGLARISFAPNPYYARKDPGFWVGGPIQKNKAFFFFDWEPQKQVQAVVFQPDLAALAPLAGVFASPNINRSLNVRLDYRITDNHTAFLRYTHDGNLNFGVPGGAPVEPSDWNHLNNWSDAFAFGVTSTLSPTLVNDFRLGWRMWNNAESPVVGSPGNVMQPVNSPDCQFPCIGAGLPQISIIGSSFAAGQSSGTAKQNRLERHYEPQDTISWQKGSHSIKFGGDMDATANLFLYHYAQLGAVALYSPTGAVAQLGGQTSTLLPNLPSVITSTNDLLNLPVRFGANAFAAGNPILPGPYHLQSERRDIRMKLYASDTWKVRSNFTVNYGFGYTYESGLLPADIPLPSYMAPLFGSPVGSSLEAAQNFKGDFGPVVGFAWSPRKNGKTVIRGGAGSYWDTASNWVKWKDLAAVGPLGNARLNIDVASFTNIFPGILVQSPSGLVPLPVGAQLPPNVFSTLTLGQFIQIYNQQWPAIDKFFTPTPPQTSGPFQYAAINYAKNGSQLYGPGVFKVPHSYQTSLGVQQDLGHDMVLTADWARRLSVNTSIGGVDLNHFSEVVNGIQTPVIPKCKTSPDLNPTDNCSLGGFTFNWDEGRAVYEGLLVKLQKRMSRHYQFIASYALQSLHASQSAVNLNNYFQSFGEALARQTLNVAGVVQLPWGFEFSLNNAYITRTPVMPVTTGVDLSGTGAVASGPLPGLSYNCGGITCGKSQVASAVAAFNSTYAGTKAPNGTTIPSYVLPPDYQFGDPQFYQDVRVTKTFSYKERYKLAIMGEFFNLFNIANLSGYNFNLDALGKGCQLTASGSAFTSCGTQTYAFGQPTNRAQQTFLSGGPRALQVGARFTF